MINSKKTFAYLAILVLLGSFNLRADKTIGGIGFSNPSIAIRSFRGDYAMKAKFQQMLIYADWFSVVSSTANADFLLDAAVRTSGRQKVLQIRLQEKIKVGNSYREKVVYELTAEASNTKEGTNLLISNTIDKIIKKIFRVEGPCSCKIAFVRKVGKIKEIYTCNFDGSEAKKLTTNRNISTEPSFGPSAKSISYTLYTTNRMKTVYANLANKKQAVVSSAKGINAGSSVSPNGRQLIITQSRGDIIDLYRLDLSNKQVTRLTKSRAVESSPCWSPDSRQFCYVSDIINRRPTLFVQSIYGGRAKQVTSSSNEYAAPDWSSDGSKICFSYKVRGSKNYQIGFVDLKNLKAGITSVTNNAAGDWESPSWTPDNRHIICSRKINGRSNIYIVDGAGKSKTARKLFKSGQYSLPDCSSRIR